MFNVPKTATGLHRFAEVHQEALQNAALILGGRRELRRAQELLEDLRLSGPVTRRMYCDTAALLELFTLTSARKMLPPGSSSHRACNLVAVNADEIKVLRDAFSDALSGSEAEDSFASEVEHMGVKYD